MNVEESPLTGWLIWSTTIVALGLASSWAFGQTIPVPAPAIDAALRKKCLKQIVDNQIYTCVEQMPQLPGGDSARAIVDAIQSQIHYPATALR